MECSVVEVVKSSWSVMECSVIIVECLCCGKVLVQCSDVEQVECCSGDIIMYIFTISITNSVTILILYSRNILQS